MEYHGQRPRAMSMSAVPETAKALCGWRGVSKRSVIGRCVQRTYEKRGLESMLWWGTDDLWSSEFFKLE